MSEQKKPQAGEWWFANDGGGRCYIVGHRDDGRAVVQFLPRGDMLVDFDGLWNHWHHEPRCNSWDWQPEPEPEWFDLTPHDGHVLRKCDQFFHSLDKCWDVPHRVSEGATVKQLKQIGYTKIRCLLKDAPPELLKPVEPPDDWVTQDRVPCRPGIDERRWSYKGHGAFNSEISNWEDCSETYSLYNTRAVHGFEHPMTRGLFLELRCRRRDLPLIPEPKPATQTIVFHEVIRTVVDDFGNTEWQLQWSTNPVKDDVKTGRTETREVGR